MILKNRLFPKKEYATKEALFDDVRSNVTDIIAMKKAEILKSCDKGVSVSCKSLDLNKLQEANKALKLDEGYYYIAVNTTRVLDSHDDFHWDGIWGKSVKEQQGTVYLCVDHELSIDGVAVRKEHVKMFTAKIPFAMIGYPYDGETEALIYQIAKDKIIHDKIKSWLDSGDAIEASVRMQYVTIELAMDSNDPQDVKAKERYDLYHPQIANKADFDYIPLFFVIREAKNVRESSLVIFGSNPVTGNITEPSKDTQHKQDPPFEQSKSVWDDFIIPHEKSIWDQFLN